MNAPNVTVQTSSVSKLLVTNVAFVLLSAVNVPVVVLSVIPAVEVHVLAATFAFEGSETCV